MSDNQETQDSGLSELFGGSDEPESSLPETTAQPEPADEPATERPDDYAGGIEVYDLYRHRVNGDETIVLLSSFGRGYQALAIDVDKAGEILATEEIGDAADREQVEHMCEYWLDANPKGVLGAADDDDSGGGLLESILGGGK